MKRYLIISLCVLALFTAVAYAATTDFVANGDITVGGVSGSDITADLTIVNGSKAESWRYSSGVFTVTNPDSTSPFKVSAHNSSVLTISIKNSDGTVAVCTNNTTPGTSYVELPSSGGTYTVSPSSTQCPSGTGGASPGGGGSPTVPPPPPPTPAPVAPRPIAPPSPPPGSPRGAEGPAIPPFQRGLGLGAQGSDVRNLQLFLNGRGFLVATSGAGSPGRETIYFGPATKGALIKFQLANGIEGIGILGPATRAKVNTLLASQSPSGSPSLAISSAAALSPEARAAAIASIRERINQLMVLLQQMISQRSAR